jgi:hypothetical protein
MFPRTSDYLIALFAVSAMFLALFAGTGPTQAATFSIIAQGHSVAMKGRITTDDDQRLDRAYRESCARRGYCPERLFLDSEGGQVLASFNVADVVVHYGLHTVVNKTGQCYSSCFMIFAAGPLRVVFPTAHIGVHSLSDEHGQETAETVYYTRLAIDILRDHLHVPEPILAKMISTPPSGMAYLTWQDLDGWVQFLP